MVHPDRPLDLYGYLCNDDLFPTVDDKSGKLRAMDDSMGIGALQECSIDSKHLPSQQNQLMLQRNKIKQHKWEESQDDAGHVRTVSITNPNEISITATEMTEITMTGDHDFDARELAMMRIAAGNIFDYKTDIIKEEEEQDNDNQIDDDDTLFPYVNSDGVEETDEEDNDDYDDDDDDVAISHISKTGMTRDEQELRELQDKLYQRSSSEKASSETSTNDVSDENLDDDEYETPPEDTDSESEYESVSESDQVSEEYTEEDTMGDYYHNSDRERELIHAITVALANEENKDI